MVRHVEVDARAELDPVDQRREELGVVEDLALPAQPRVLVLEGVEGVGIHDHEALELVLVEGLDVLLGEELEEAALPGQAGRVAVAPFLGAEDREVDAEGRHDPGHRPGGVLAAGVVAGVVRHVPQDVHRAGRAG